MWGKITIPIFRLWLYGLYGLYGPRCPLSPKRPINLISLSLSPGLRPYTLSKNHHFESCSTFCTPAQWSWRGVYWFHLVRLSVCEQNRVCSVSSRILTRSISSLHILSSNFRRCVARKLFFKIRKIWNFGYPQNAGVLVVLVSFRVCWMILAIFP